MNSLLGKFLSFSYGGIISALVGFASVPILTRLLPPQEYGKLTLFITLTGIIATTLSFGTDQAFIRFFYEEVENNRAKLLKKSLIVPFILTVVFCIVMVFYGKGISFEFLKDDSNLTIILITLQSIILMVNNYALLIVRMEQRGHLYSFLQINNKVGYLIWILVIATFIKDKYIIAASSLFLANIIVSAIAIFTQRKYWYSNQYVSNVGIKNKSRDILSFSAPLFLTLLINWVFQAADKFALQRWSSYTQLGIYSSAITFIVILSVLQSSFTTFWTPLSLERYEESPNNKEFFKSVSEIVAFIMLSAGLIIVMFRDIFSLLLGENYRDAVFIMPMLLFMPIAFSISETTLIGINFMKKPRYHLIISIITALLDIFLLYILVPILGAKGAAISTAITYILFLCLRSYFSYKLYPVDFNLKKLLLNIIFLFSYMLFLTFNKTSYFTLVTGLCLLLFYCYQYRVVFLGLIQRIIRFIRKGEL